MRATRAEAVGRAIWSQKNRLEGTKTAGRMVGKGKSRLTAWHIQPGTAPLCLHLARVVHDLELALVILERKPQQAGAAEQVRVHVGVPAEGVDEVDDRHLVLRRARQRDLDKADLVVAAVLRRVVLQVKRKGQRVWIVEVAQQLHGRGAVADVDDVGAAPDVPRLAADDALLLKRPEVLLGRLERGENVDGPVGDVVRQPLCRRGGRIWLRQNLGLLLLHQLPLALGGGLDDRGDVEQDVRFRARKEVGALDHALKLGDGGGSVGLC